MMATNTRKPFFERLKTGLEEGIAHAKGELTLKTVDVPEAPPEIDAETLVALREQAKMSQAEFASLRESRMSLWPPPSGRRFHLPSCILPKELRMAPFPFHSESLNGTIFPMAVFLSRRPGCSRPKQFWIAPGWRLYLVPAFRLATQLAFPLEYGHEEQHKRPVAGSDSRTYKRLS
jgi:hypothetical protein